MQINELDASKKPMQNVKQRFFALRNGMLADTLRRAGSPYRIIFGLNLPQLQQVASAFGVNPDLADELWNDTAVRESRLLAPMLVNPQEFNKQKASKWLGNLTGATEELDILCHSLLRKTSFASEIAQELIASNDSLMRYVALRLYFSQVSTSPAAVAEIARKEIERNDNLTIRVANQLKEEAEFVLESNG